MYVLSKPSVTTDLFVACRANLDVKILSSLLVIHNYLNVEGWVALVAIPAFVVVGSFYFQQSPIYSQVGTGKAFPFLHPSPTIFPLCRHTWKLDWYIVKYSPQLAK